MNKSQETQSKPEAGQTLARPACSAWHRTTETFPPQDVEVEITHPNFIGTRTAKLRGLSGWYLTDCTRPETNCYASLNGSGWRLMPNAQALPRGGATDYGQTH